MQSWSLNRILVIPRCPKETIKRIDQQKRPNCCTLAVSFFVSIIFFFKFHFPFGLSSIFVFFFHLNYNFCSPLVPHYRLSLTIISLLFPLTNCLAVPDRCDSVSHWAEATVRPMVLWLTAEALTITTTTCSKRRTTITKKSVDPRNDPPTCPFIRWPIIPSTMTLIRPTDPSCTETMTMKTLRMKVL